MNIILYYLCVAWKLHEKVGEIHLQGCKEVKQEIINPHILILLLKLLQIGYCFL